MADEIAARVSIPLLHIADRPGEKIREAGFSKVGLLATAFTMEHDSYKGRLISKFGIDIVVPEADDRKVIHDIIYRELVVGEVKESSRERYREAIMRLASQGAEAIIPGCTEVVLLISQNDSSVPVFDTTTLHALAAVDAALS